jgi:outer membrane protein assembly factor BamB
MTKRWAVLGLRSTAAALAVIAVLAGCGASSSDKPGLAGVGDLPAPATAWPAAMFEARHSSNTTAIGPQHGKIKWSVTLDGDLTPGPVIGVDGSVLEASNSGVLTALDPATGKTRWEFNGGASYGNDLSTSPAVLTGGTILWPGPEDQLFALDPQGKKLWQQGFADEPLSPAIAGAGRVYVADLAGHLSALEITGTEHRLVWTLDVKGTDFGSPTVGPDGTIYTTAGNSLVAVRDLGDKGVQRWRHKTKDQVEVSNAVAPDGIVILGTDADKQYGIRPNGSTAWSYDKGEYTYSSSVVRPDGKAYFGDNQGRLTVLDSATGRQLLRSQGSSAPVKTSIWTSPAVDARGDYYWATQSGHIYGFAPSGVQLFDINAGAAVNSYPAIGADGTLYFGTTAGRFLAIAPG